MHSVRTVDAPSGNRPATALRFLPPVSRLLYSLLSGLQVYLFGCYSVSSLRLTTAIAVESAQSLSEVTGLRTDRLRARSIWKSYVKTKVLCHRVHYNGRLIVLGEMIAVCCETILTKWNTALHTKLTVAHLVKKLPLLRNPKGHGRKKRAVLGCHSASSGNLLSTFRDNLPADGTDSLSRNVVKKLNTTRCVITQKSAVLLCFVAET
jgi:hypothetical protein